MIKSMTGYAKGESTLAETLFVAEIRSHNHRYRDLILRLPRNFQILEEKLKSVIASRIRRGRVEASLFVESSSEWPTYELELNRPLVKSYLKVFEELRQQFGMSGDISLDSFCQMKDILVFKPPPAEIEQMEQGFVGALEKCLDSLEAMRRKEGKALEEDLMERLSLVEKSIGSIEARVPGLVDEYRRRLKENVKKMLHDELVDETRLAHEVALFAERSDITEEIVRVRSHLKQFRESLSMDEPVGRRLDFLLQEINREVNTISSKASDSFISREVVEMKAELERLREQVQNVE